MGKSKSKFRPEMSTSQAAQIDRVDLFKWSQHVKYFGNIVQQPATTSLKTDVDLNCS